MTQAYHDYLYNVSYNSPWQSGIYALVNVRSGKMYVGSTKNFNNRAAQHFKALEEGIHHNRLLQYSFDAAGPEAFSFCVLEYVPDVGRLTLAEQTWLNRLRRRAMNLQHKVSRPEWEVVEPGESTLDVTLPWEEV